MKKSRKKWSKIQREKIHKKYNGRCAYCGRKITINEMQMDHIISLKNGGSNNIDNINPSCRLCNERKGSMTTEAYKKQLQKDFRKLRKYKTFEEAGRFGMIKIHGWNNKFYYEIDKEERENC